MPKADPSRPRMVREPVQVYLAADDSQLLARLAEETGLSKAEILRRGIRSFAAERRGDSPILLFLAEGENGPWPENVAGDHDAALAESYRAPGKRR